MVFDPLGESRRRVFNRRNSRRKKYEEEKEIVEFPKENGVSSSIEEEEDGNNDRRWPSFADEEYIVFSFRKDGAIHMKKERKPSETSENRQTDQKLFCNHREIASTNEEDNTTTTTPLNKLVSLFTSPSFLSMVYFKSVFFFFFLQGNEKEDNIVWPPDEIKEVNHIEPTNDDMGGESVHSNKSDSTTSSSRGSFAFPV